MSKLCIRCRENRTISQRQICPECEPIVMRERAEKKNLQRRMKKCDVVLQHYTLEHQKAIMEFEKLKTKIEENKKKKPVFSDRF